MIVKATYVCSICNEEYETEEEAVSCEKECSTCPCQRENKIYYSEELYVGCETYASAFIDFVTNQIGVSVPEDSRFKYKERRFDISYCPFCGRRLEKK